MAEYIYRTVKCKKGNYMIFFPSYKLMNQVYDIFTEIHTDFDTIIQTSGMKEEEAIEDIELKT